MRGFWRIASSTSPGPSERLPTAWVGGQMAQLDRLDGDIDTLMARIAHIRTWTYITHRGDWVEGAAEWQERARGIEDRLSDALHDRITQRFVDRRSAFLVRHLAGDGELLASVDKEGEVRVEGTYVGRLDGFRFVPDAADGEAMRTLITAANRVLRSEVGARARRLAGDDDEAFTLDAHGEILWQGGPVGRLTAGETMLAPRVEVRAGDFLEGEARERVRQRLQAFRQRRDRAPAGAAVRGAGIAAVRSRRAASPSSSSAALGAVPTEDVAPALKSLDRASRRALARLGVRFGTETVYVEPLLGPDAVRFRALLWAVRHGRTPPQIAGRTPTRQGDRDRSGPPAVVLCRDRAPGRCAAGAAAGPAGATGGGGRATRSRLGLLPPMRNLARIGRRRSRRAAPGSAGARLSRGYRRGSRILHRPSRADGRPTGESGGRTAAARSDNPFAKLKELRFA